MLRTLKNNEQRLLSINYCPAILVPVVNTLIGLALILLLPVSLSVLKSIKMPITPL